MKRKSKVTAVEIGKENVAIGFTEDQGNYLKAIQVAQKIVEELTNRNMESFSLSETFKIRPITLALTTALAEKMISLENLKKHEDEVKLLIKDISIKLKEIDMLSEDYM